MLSSIFFAFALAWIVAVLIWVIVTARGIRKAIYGNRKGHAGDVLKAVAPGIVALVVGAAVLFGVSFLLR